MREDEIQEQIDKFHYWDMRVKTLECNNFSDEVKLVYDDSDGYEVVYHFIGCYRVVFEHVKNYDKLRSVKNMTIPQIPYFLQEVNVTSVIEENRQFYVSKMNIFPLYTEIWSKEINIMRNRQAGNRLTETGSAASSTITNT